MTNNMENNKTTFKDFWNNLKENFKDPTKRKIASKKAMIFFGVIFRAVILIGLSFVIIAPILQKLSAALRHPSDITNPQVIWIPETWSFVNFEIGWEVLEYGSALFRTLFISTGCMFIQVVASAVAGYAFARLRFKGSNIVFLLVLLSLIVPTEAMDSARRMLLAYNTFFGLNLVGNIFALFILAAFGQGIRSAIFIFLFRQFFKGLPVELEESAQVDGAGVIRTFWSVMLPNARGGIVTVALFSFVWQWNDYYFANLLNYSSNFPLLATTLAGTTERLDVLMNTWVGAGREVIQGIGDTSVTSNPAFLSLISNTEALLLMAPLLIGYFFVQKLFVESIERTGIVG